MKNNSNNCCMGHECKLEMIAIIKPVLIFNVYLQQLLILINISN